MTLPHKQLSVYKETSINTATPTKLVVMLYEGAIRFLRQADQDIRNGDLVSKRQSVGRAIAIVQHLQLTLDSQKGQELARELDRLYSYTLSRILAGSTKLDPDAIEEAIKVLSLLHSAWEELAKMEQQQSDPAVVVTNQTVTGGFQLNG